MRNLIAVSFTALLLVPVAAEAQTVAGKLSKRDARAFLQRQLPKDAPTVFLRDERAGFYRTARLTIVPAVKCERHSEAAVDCRVTARLNPDPAHRKAHWDPIECKGVVRALHLSNGALAGDVQDYRCVTVPKKKPRKSAY